LPSQTRTEELRAMAAAMPSKVSLDASAPMAVDQRPSEDAALSASHARADERHATAAAMRSKVSLDTSAPAAVEQRPPGAEALSASPWHARAEQLRVMADTLPSKATRPLLPKIADIYDSLASEAKQTRSCPLSYLGSRRVQRCRPSLTRGRISLRLRNHPKTTSCPLSRLRLHRSRSCRPNLTCGRISLRLRNDPKTRNCALSRLRSRPARQCTTPSRAAPCHREARRGGAARSTAPNSATSFQEPLAQDRVRIRSPTT
jgi:hypothetical protein